MAWFRSCCMRAYTTRLFGYLVAATSNNSFLLLFLESVLHWRIMLYMHTVHSISNRANGLIFATSHSMDCDLIFVLYISKCTWFDSFFGQCTKMQIQFYGLFHSLLCFPMKYYFSRFYIIIFWRVFWNLEVNSENKKMCEWNFYS